MDDPEFLARYFNPPLDLSLNSLATKLSLESGLSQFTTSQSLAYINDEAVIDDNKRSFVSKKDAT